MNDKITDEQFLEVLENNPGNTQEEIGKVIGISQQAVSLRMIALKDKIIEKAEEIIKKFAINAAQNLIKQSGDSLGATLKLLEMSGVYIPTTRQNVNSHTKTEGKIELIIKDYKDEEKPKDENI